MNKLVLSTLVGASLLFAACDKGGKATSPSLDNQADTLAYVLGAASSPSQEELKKYLVEGGSDSTYVEAFLKGLKEGLKVPEDKKEMAYQMGVEAGMRMKLGMLKGLEKRVFVDDTTQQLSTKQFLKGFHAGIEDKVALQVGKNLLNRQSIMPYAQELQQRMVTAANEKRYADTKKKNVAFLTAKAKEAGVQKLANGVLYKELQAGTGEAPTVNDQAEVNYEGRLIDGKIFDSSNGNPVPMPLASVVPGFREALLHMKVGSEWEVYIPAEQAYGSQEMGQIPPYSTLVFKIKLVKVTKGAATPQMPQMPQMP